MIKCIVSDMDGTLLNRKERISEENAKAIRAAQDKGIDFLIATGRSNVEAFAMLHEAGLKCPVLSLNGAVAHDEGGNKLHSIKMDEEEYRKTRSILDDTDLHLEIYTSEGCFSLDMDYSIATLVDVLAAAMPGVSLKQIAKRVRERFELGHVKEIGDFDDLYHIEGIEFYKILAFSTDIEKLGRVASSLKKATGLSISSSGPENLEITAKEAQKGIAVEKYVQARGIGLHETMAIGDSYNDVSMFEKAGRPVAMGNAPNDLKKLCGEVTLTNEEDGVAFAILKAMGNNE
ncbi:MAG: Cof-type HAD-IIB family hydrolase [Bacillus sp. (in: firmicutes)]